MNSIKEHRLKNELTQKELANKIGVSQRMVAYYESGSALPNGKTLLKLSNLLNISTDELLKNYTPEPPTSSDETNDTMKHTSF